MPLGFPFSTRAWEPSGELLVRMRAQSLQLHLGSYVGEACPPVAKRRGSSAGLRQGWEAAPVGTQRGHGGLDPAARGCKLPGIGNSRISGPSWFVTLGFILMHY